MSKIIIAINTTTWDPKAISLLLTAVQPVKVVAEKIYLKTLKGTIEVCLS